MMRNCFFGGAMHAVLLLQNGHGDQLASDIGMNPERVRQLGHRPVSLDGCQRHLRLEPASRFLRVRFMSSRAFGAFWAGLHLSQLSHFWGPAQTQFDRKPQDFAIQMCGRCRKAQPGGNLRKL